MKVSFFHLMPYQDLPDDFAQQHHSAWVDLPNENFDPAKGNEYYAQYIDQLRYADEVGFDGFVMPDHYPGLLGDNEARERARAWCVGYLRALIQATAI